MARNTPFTVERLHSYLLWLLSRREYSAYELTQKACHRWKQATPAVVGEALEKLQQAGLQSDAKVVQAVQRTHPTWGQKRIALACRQKGIAPQVIAAAPTTSEKERALAALHSFVGKKQRKDIDPKKALAYLARRGFEYSTCTATLKEFLEEEPFT